MHAPRMVRLRARGRSLDRRLVEGAYLTDGTRLFRCDRRDQGTVVLENCRTLELICCAFAELGQAELRLVVPMSHPPRGPFSRAGGGPGASGSADASVPCRRR